MAPPKLLLPVLLLVLLSFVANATRQKRSLHLPVFFRDRDTVFPPDDAALASAGASTQDRQLRSPVQSGVPYNSGEYFAAIGVGSPSSRALLVIDTGSDLTWLQCAPCRRCYGQATPLYDPRRSATYRRVPFAAPRCRDLRFPVRDARTEGCLYTVVYGDGSSSRGEVATDRLAFPAGDDAIHDNVTLGCGRDNEGLFGSGAAGVLGVGRGALSLTTQLAAQYGRVFAYCLGDRDSSSSSSSSYLVFGRAPPELPSSAAAFTPLRTNPRKPSLYYVDMAGFSVDGAPVAGFPAADLALDAATGRGGVVVDSGTSISRFAADTYAALRDAFDARAAKAGMRNLRRNISVYDTCYDLGGGRDVAATALRVPAVALHFAGGADMALPRKNYLVPVDCGGGRTCHCLAFVGFKPSDNERNMLGNVQQQGFQVVFDEERKRIGFAPNGCSD